MSFVQTISFHTDRIDRLVELDQRWVEETAGRRTILDAALYRDRADPTHYVSVNHFASWADAQANSALPETDALAREAAGLASGPVTFIDLDLVDPVDLRRDAAAGLRTLLETNVAPPWLLADDVEVDLFVPEWHVAMRGADELIAGLREEAPSRTIERWDVHPSGDTVVVEFAQRNHATDDRPATLAIGAILARLGGGRIVSLRVHCAGNWSAELEQRIAASQRAGVSA